MREHTDLVRAWRALPLGTEAVLATVVATRGSVYRRPGARMLLTREGWIAGSISGGCIESDLVQTAFDRTADGPALVTYDASAPDDILLGFGLGCNGAVDVLMHRLPPDGGPLAVIESVLQDRRDRWLETYANGAWNSGDGSPWSEARAEGGTVGEGVSGAEARAKDGSNSGWKTVGGAAEGGDAKTIPQKSFGVASQVEGVLITERLQPPPALVIFGAGHDAVPLVRISKEIGWHVTVVDGRSAYAREDRFPEADRVLVSPPSNPVDIEEGASVVVMTHSFANDVALLSWLLDSPAGYIGVLGPIHRTRRILEEQGLDGSRLYAPIGLDLGAEGPDEIALAIVAEIQAVRAGRTASHLKGRMTPLHENKESSHVGRL